MKQLLPIISLLALPVMAANSPYLKHVYEYMPAPGQFTNFIPMYEDGDDANDMRMKAEEGNPALSVAIQGWT